MAAHRVEAGLALAFVLVDAPVQALVFAPARAASAVVDVVAILAVAVEARRTALAREARTWNSAHQHISRNAKMQSNDRDLIKRETTGLRTMTPWS